MRERVMFDSLQSRHKEELCDSCAGMLVMSLHKVASMYNAAHPRLGLEAHVVIMHKGLQTRLDVKWRAFAKWEACTVSVAPPVSQTERSPVSDLPCW